MGRVLLDLGGVGYAPAGRGQPQGRDGNLRVITTNLLPGYIRKNGVPHSGNAVLTEYFERVTGGDGQVYLALTAMVDDPTYLTQPFVRTYQFKRLADATGWDPTLCSAK
jgi:hypothetical protein